MRLAVDLQEDERARQIRQAKEAVDDDVAVRKLHRELADLAVDVERERRVSFGESVERYDTLVRQDSVKQAVKAANAEQERRVSAYDPASPTKPSPERAWCEGGVPSTLEHLLQRRSSADELVSRGVLRQSPEKAIAATVAATRHPRLGRVQIS